MDSIEIGYADFLTLQPRTYELPVGLQPMNVHNHLWALKPRAYGDIRPMGTRSDDPFLW